MGLKPFTIRSNVQEVPPPTQQSNIQPIQNTAQYSIRPDKQFIWEYFMTQGDETFYYTGGKSFYITKVLITTYYVGAAAGTTFQVICNTYDITTGSGLQQIFRHNTQDTNVDIHPLNLDFIPPLYIKQDTNTGFYCYQDGIGAFQNVKLMIYGFFAD